MEIKEWHLALDGSFTQQGGMREEEAGVVLYDPDDISISSSSGLSSSFE